MALEITFDLAKDLENVRKHGISLERAKDFDFDSALYRLDDREDYGETHFRVLGFLDARLYALVVAERDNGLRAISLRKAERHEEREYDDAQ